MTSFPKTVPVYVNKAFAAVTGQKVNKGAGYGLEIPCTYRLYSPPAYINRMKELFESLAAYGHIYIFCFRVWFS